MKVGLRAATAPRTAIRESGRCGERQRSGAVVRDEGSRELDCESERSE